MRPPVRLLVATQSEINRRRRRLRGSHVKRGNSRVLLQLTRHHFEGGHRGELCIISLDRDLRVCVCSFNDHHTCAHQLRE